MIVMIMIIQFFDPSTILKSPNGFSLITEICMEMFIDYFCNTLS